jgi:outer membrane protein OmpU
MGINMKKTLFSTTALATVGLLAASAGDAFGQAAAPAAEKMKLSLGGYMTQYVGWAEQDSDWEAANTPNNGYKHFDQKSDSEVYFLGSLTLDNGLTISVRADLELDTQSSSTANNLDESYMTIGSATLGTLTLGSTNPAGSDLLVQAPGAGLITYTNNDHLPWVLAGGQGPSQISAGHQSGGGSDDNLVKYISPSIAGFRAGISYSPDQVDAASMPLSSAVDLTDVGLQYSGKFGDFGVRGSAIYWMQEGASDTAQLDGWAVGGDITFADFTFGGAYGEQNHNGSGALAVGTSSSALDTWLVGIAYNPGPFAVGLTYGRSESPGTETDPDDSSYSKWRLGATYILGPGVTVGAEVIFADSQVESDAAAGENKAWAVVGGIKVDF